MISREEKKIYKEEIKKKLKLKPILPQIETQKVFVPKIQSISKIETNVITIEKQIPEIKLKPVPIKLIPKGVKAVTIKSKEIISKSEIKTIKEEMTKVELKPKVLKIEIKQSEIPEFTKINVIKPSLEIPKVLAKIPKIEKIKPEIKVPKAPIEYMPAITPKPIEGKLVIEAFKESLKEEKTVKELDLEPYSPDIFSLPEGLLDKDSKGSGLFGKISPEGLVCIVVDRTNGFDKLIELLCSILFRIKNKGLPSVWSQGICAETCIEFRRKEDIVIFRNIEKILRNAISSIKNGKISEAKQLIGQLKSLSLEQAFRFLILPAENKKEFKDIVEIIMDPRYEFRYYIRKLYAYTCKELSFNDQELGLIFRGMFGFIKPRPEITFDIGKHCLDLYNRFYERLDLIKNEVERKLLSQRQPKVGQELNQEESWLHYTLKFFVIKHLIDNLKIPEESIDTEKRLGFAIPDVYVDQFKQIAIEIETFYGTIDPYNCKLIPKINEYKDAQFKGELWLVVPNIQALLYVDDLLKLRKDYRHDLNIEIYTLDLTGEGAELIYKEKRQPGLIKLVDLLKLFKDKGLKRSQEFLKISNV